LQIRLHVLNLWREKGVTTFGKYSGIVTGVTSYFEYAKILLQTSK